MEPMLTYKDVAAMIRMPLGTVYALVSQKRIPHIRLGRRLVRFRQSDVLAWLASNTVSAPKPTPFVRQARSRAKRSVT